MKKSLTVLLLSAMLASGASVFAQDPPASTTLSVRGTIDNYDASSRTLSLSTSGGTVRFPVASTSAHQSGRAQGGRVGAPEADRESRDRPLYGIGRHQESSNPFTCSENDGGQMSTSVLVVDGDLQVDETGHGHPGQPGVRGSDRKRSRVGDGQHRHHAPCARAHRPRHAGLERPRVLPPRPRGIEGAHHRHVWQRRVRL